MNRLSDKIWRIVERFPWLVLAALTALHTAFTLRTRSLWFSDEVRYADAYENLVKGGKWVVLSLNGQPYPDKPPVYFWFLRLLDGLPHVDMPAVFPLGAAVSGFLYLLASCFLARMLGYSRRVGLAAGLVLMTTPFFLGLLHYSRMDLLFSAFIVGASGCFFRAAHRDAPKDAPWLIAGFLLAGLAMLTKGPIGILFPGITAILFVCWKGEPSRMLRKPVFAGLALFTAMTLAWMVAAYFTEGWAFIENITYKQVYERATHTFHHLEPWYWYFIAFPLALLPWTLFPVALSWRRFATAGFWCDAWTARRGESGDGAAWCWMSFLSGFALLSCLSGKVLIYILPLFAPLAILIADALIAQARDGRTGAKRFWAATGGLFVLLGIGTMVVKFVLPHTESLRGNWLAGAVMLAGGALLLWLRRRSSLTLLPLCAVLLLIWLVPVGQIVAPSLDETMSPRRTAEELAKAADEGYFPIAHKIYSGIFTYYAGRDILETSHYDELDAVLSEHPKAALIIDARRLREWPDRPDNLRRVSEQWISDRTYYLLLTSDAGTGGAPGDQSGGVSGESSPLHATPEATAPEAGEMRIEPGPDESSAVETHDAANHEAGPGETILTPAEIQTSATEETPEISSEPGHTTSEKATESLRESGHE